MPLGGYIGPKAVLQYNQALYSSKCTVLVGGSPAVSLDLLSEEGSQ